MPNGPVVPTIEKPVGTLSLREQMADHVSRVNEASTPALPPPAATANETTRTASKESPKSLADALAVFAKLPAEVRDDLGPQQPNGDLKLSTDNSIRLPNPYRIDPSASRPLEVAEILAADSAAAEALAVQQTKQVTTTDSKIDSADRQPIVQRLIGWHQKEDAPTRKPSRSGGILNQLFGR